MREATGEANCLTRLQALAAHRQYAFENDDRLVLFRVPMAPGGRARLKLDLQHSQCFLGENDGNDGPRFVEAKLLPLFGMTHGKTVPACEDILLARAAGPGFLLVP